MKKKEAAKLIERTARWKWTNWLLSFGLRNLDELSRDEWETLQREIVEFCEMGPVSRIRTVGRILPQVPYVTFDHDYKHKITPSRRQIKEWQGVVSQALNSLFPLTEGQKALTDSRECEDEPGIEMPLEDIGKWFVPATISGTNLTRYEYTVIDARGKRIPAASVDRTDSAPWPHIFWWRIAEMFQTFGSVIRRCLHCRTLFLRIKRQTYCSTRCSGNARSKKWYEAHKHKEETRERRHQYHVKQVRKKHPNAKVQRRVKH